MNRAIAARVASVLLRYPSPGTLAALPVVSAALAELPASFAGRLRPLVDHLSGGEPTALAAEYVELFDFRRRCCLYLTYYTAGDTRQRGVALVSFAAAYRQAGLSVVDGELPDYLPAVLDLAAIDDRGWELLRDNRIGLDLLSTALREHGSVYRHAVDAVLALLPAARVSDVAAAAKLARTGPPREEVGLSPYAVRSSR